MKSKSSPSLAAVESNTYSTHDFLCARDAVGFVLNNRSATIAFRCTCLHFGAFRRIRRNVKAGTRDPRPRVLCNHGGAARGEPLARSAEPKTIARTAGSDSRPEFLHSVALREK